MMPWLDNALGRGRGIAAARAHLSKIIPAAFIVVFAVLALTALAVEYSSYRREHARERQHTSEGYQAQRNKVEQLCSGFIARGEDAAHQECLQRRAEADRDQQRAEYDLKAQQDMAEYAFGGFWISVGSMLLTAVGIVFVVRSLNEATESNRLARQSIVAENRPWLCGENVSLKKIDLVDGKLTAEIVYQIRNIGNSVARDVQITLQTVPRRDTSNMQAMADITGSIEAEYARGPKYGTVIFPVESAETFRDHHVSWNDLDAITIQDDLILPRFVISMFYKAPFSDDVMMTAKIYMISLLDSEYGYIKALSKKDIGSKASLLCLVESPDGGVAR